jgi:hypothetical protein
MSLMVTDSFSIVTAIKAIKAFRGVDAAGISTLVLIFEEEPKIEIRSKKIASRTQQEGGKYRVYISLVDEDETSKEIFDVFVNDMISHLSEATTEEQVVEIASKRFKYWMELFARAKSGTYNEQWIRGFWGELYFLGHVLANKIGIDDAVKAWVGPEKSNQDFITQDKIFEIKTKTQSGATVKISNDNQLSKGDDMFLTVVTVSKSSELSDESMNLSDLIGTIDNQITVQSTRMSFHQSLLELELFPSEAAALYDKSAYKFEDLNYYKIRQDFPLIDHKEMPLAVNSYSYELILSEIEPFMKDESDVWN